MAFIGALAWISLGTRLDIAFVASLLAIFGHNLGRPHWDVTELVLHYLKGTSQGRPRLGGKCLEVAAFTDPDLGSHRNSRRSTGAYGIKIENGAVRCRSLVNEVALLVKRISMGR